MKHILSTLAMYLLIQKAMAQTPYPPIIWSSPIKTVSTLTEDPGMDIYDLAVEKISGSSYVASQVYSTCTYANGQTFTPDANNEFVAVAKYDFAGTLIWVKSFGFLGDQIGGIKLTTNHTNGFFMSGTFNTSELDFGNGVKLTRNCLLDCDEIFLASFDANGNARWARSIYGENDTYFAVHGLEADQSGKLWVSGNYDGVKANFGATFQYDSLLENNMFLASYEAGNGNVQAVHFAGAGSGSVELQHLDINDNKQMVLTGFYTGQVVFENGLSLNSSGGSGYFVAGLDEDGQVVWVKNLSSNDYFDVLGIDMDGSGQAYLAIDASVDLAVNNTVIKTISTNYAGIVLKLGESTEEIPVFIPYNTDDYRVMDVKLDLWGNIYTTGFTTANMSFGGMNLQLQGCADALITITNAEATHKMARLVGGPGCEAIVNNTYGASMGFDQVGFMYAAGLFFDGFSADSISYTNTGAFVAKFNTSIVGTDEPVFAGNITLGPNPSNGHFTLTLEEMPAPNTQLCIYDLNGKMLYRQEIAGLQTELSTNLPSGMYTLTLQNGRQFYRNKLVVNR